MNVRHLVAQDNVTPDGLVRDPLRVRHGTLRAGRVFALAGEIDPQTHLNLDYPAHRLDVCVVVERLELGAPVNGTDSGEGLVLAAVSRPALRGRGQVDLGARRAAWLRAIRAHRLQPEGVP